MKTIAVLLTLVALGGEVSAQTVTDKARQQITEEKESARIREAKRLLEERDAKQARIREIDKRLTELDFGAEAKTEKNLSTTLCISTNGTIATTYC